MFLGTRRVCARKMDFRLATPNWGIQPIYARSICVRTAIEHPFFTTLLCVYCFCVFCVVIFLCWCTVPFIVLEILCDDASATSDMSSDEEADNITFALMYYQTLRSWYIEHSPTYTVTYYDHLESSFSRIDTNFLLHIRLHKESFSLLCDYAADYWEFQRTVGELGTIYRPQAPVK